MAERVTNLYHGDQTSTLGYDFIGVNYPKEINKLSNSEYQYLLESWYLGNDIENYIANYYYYENNSAVLINNYVDIVEYAGTSTTGKYYYPRIARENLQYLPNNTEFYLTLSINSGDIYLTNDYNSFITYSSYVDTGTTGTITNTSGDVTGNIDLSGIQAGIQNANQNYWRKPQRNHTKRTKRRNKQHVK